MASLSAAIGPHTAVPQPAVGDFDIGAETVLLMADLRDEIPGFGRVRILSTVVTRDDWPPQHGGRVRPAEREPVANLWNVGDGVKEYGNGGTTACAERAIPLSPRARCPAGRSANRCGGNGDKERAVRALAGSGIKWIRTAAVPEDNMTRNQRGRPRPVPRHTGRSQGRLARRRVPGHGFPGAGLPDSGHATGWIWPARGS